jgi:O-antigen/teichoic acid export membrane protein
MIISEFKLLRYGLDWGILKEVLILSIPITPRSITILISTQSDKYMLGVLGSMGNVGMYSLAMRLSTVLNTYMIALQNVYTPHVFKILFSNDSKKRQELGLYITRMTYLSLLPAAILALFASEIIWVLFPVGYAGLDILLSVLSIYYGIMFFGKITSKQLVYAEKTGLITKLSIFFSLFNIALNIPMIYFFGALGAVLSTLINGAFYTYFSFILAQKYCYIEWEINIILLLTIYLFLCCLLNFCFSLLHINYQTILIFKILFFSYYIYTGYTLGVLTKSNAMKVAFFLKKR